MSVETPKVPDFTDRLREIAALLEQIADRWPAASQATRQHVSRAVGDFEKDLRALGLLR